MRNRFFALLGMVFLLLMAACAPMGPFKSDPADVALRQKVTAAIGEYAQSVTVSAAGGRIYLSGWVPNFNEREYVLEHARAVEGVKDVKDDIRLTDVGSLGGNDDSGQGSRR